MRQQQTHQSSSSGAPNEQVQCCAWPGCDAVGVYPAPKDPRRLNDRQMFCLEHVRRYNASWNFFGDMSTEEIIAYQHGSLHGHRQTSPMGAGAAGAHQEEIRRSLFGDFFGDESQEQAKPVDQNEKQSLDALGLVPPVTGQLIKQKYKQLVKKYHPDVNGNKGEERLKKINLAYTYLKNIYSL